MFGLTRQEKDPRPLLIAPLVVALALVGPALAGCGGGSGKETGDRAAGEEAEQARTGALNEIPEADRTAFLQLATALGTVRARAAPVAVGTASHLTNPAALLAARSQVSRLQPVDQELARLRSQLIPVVTRFARAPISGAASRRAARAAIDRADRIEAGLRSYAQRTPAIGGAIPD